MDFFLTLPGTDLDSIIKFTTITFVIQEQFVPEDKYNIVYETRELSHLLKVLSYYHEQRPFYPLYSYSSKKAIMCI